MVERFDNVLAIIPARRESKRLPGKNKMMLCFGGLPLWGNTVDIALTAGINNIAVSTDDNEILDKIELLFPTSNILGLRRSPEMADDGASTEDVILEVVQQVTHHPTVKYDTICLLQPTSPTLQPSTLKHAIHQYYSNKYPCLVAVNPDFKPCGAFYIFNMESFFQHATIWMPGMAVYTVDEKESVDIDYIYDFRIAEAVMDGLVIKK